MDAEAELITMFADVYARARRAALDAAELVSEDMTGELEKQVDTAVEAADRTLSYYDDAWLGLRAAHLEMVAATRPSFAQRTVLYAEAAPAIQAAVGRYGLDNAFLDRILAARGRAELPPPRLLKRADRALGEFHKTRDKHGPTSPEWVTAAFKLAETYRDLAMPADAANWLWHMLSQQEPTVSTYRVARDAAISCHDLAEVVLARRCVEVSAELEDGVFELSMPNSTEDEKRATSSVRASMRGLRARILIGAGDAASAEPLLGEVLTTVAELAEYFPDGEQANSLRQLEALALNDRGNALLALERPSEAYSCFFRAHRLVSDDEGEAPQARSAYYFNSAVYASGEWEKH